MLLVVSLGVTLARAVTAGLVLWVAVELAGGELVDALDAGVAAGAAVCVLCVPAAPAAVVNDAHVVVGVGLAWLLLLLLPVPAGTGTPAADDRSAEAWPSGTPPPPPAPLWLVSPTDALNCPTTWRSGGTAASMTPTANKAMPTARAGRSIASRQSLGCCRGRRAWPDAARGTPRAPAALCPPRTAARARSARSPRATAARGRRAWAGRDRILYRMRSRPSAPGSTWFAAACSSRRTNSAKSSPPAPSGP